MFTLVLRCGKEASIPKGLLDKFDRFRQHPELISSATYKITSNISPEVLALFLERVYGTESTGKVTEENADVLWDLCDELGFSGFDDDLRAVLGDGSSVHRRDVIALRNRLDRQNVVLEEQQRRLMALERQLQMQRDLSLQVSRLQSEVQKLVALTDDVQQLRKEVGEKSCATDAKVPCVKTQQCLETKENEKKPTQMDMSSEAPSRGNRMIGPSEKLIGIIEQFREEDGANPERFINIDAYYDDSARWMWESNIASQDHHIFWSINETNSYVGYDLELLRVILTGYSIKSSGFAPGGPHPKSWVIEVSNNRTTWIAVDCQDNNNSLNNKNVIRYFQINPLPREKYRYIRFRQTAKNHAGNDVLTMSSLDIFGTMCLHDAPVAQFAHNPARPLDGIIAGITHKCGGNVDQTVSVITSSRLNVSANVTRMDKSIWKSPCKPNASLSFDFKVWRVTPTAYMITSGGTYPNDEHRLEGHHPKSWVFEGSNDNCTWELLDRRDNNCDLNAEYVTCNFSINSHSKKSFRFVRLRMTGKNHAGVDGCVLSAFDVFGTISLG